MFKNIKEIRNIKDFKKLASGFAPVVYAESMAAVAPSVSNNAVFNALLTKVISLIVVPIVWVVLTFSVLVFMWGLVQFVMNADDPGARSTGWQHILWGIIGFTIIICAYGIVRLVTNTLGVPSPF